MPEAEAKIFGVLGGMGALASARFVETLYRRNPAALEQAQPIVLLRSNPRIPDRTATMLAGRPDLLAAALAAELDALQRAGADRMVMCCFTAHLVWDMLPEASRARMVSLIDALYQAPELAARRRLVLCTAATRQLGLLQNHPRFDAFTDHLIFADDDAQQTIHHLIYDLKRGARADEVAPTLRALAHQTGAEGFVAACTEIHLLDRLPDDALDLIDPLHLIADDLATILA